MSSRAAVAPPGSLPVFGWSGSRRGLGPPVRAAVPCLWEARADLLLHSRKALLGLPYFELLQPSGGGWLGKLCSQRRKETWRTFPLLWARVGSSSGLGRREICWAHSRPDGIRGMEGREQDQGEAGAVIVAWAAHPGLASGTPGPWPN